MKKIFSLLFLAGSLVFVSCKKEKISDPAPNPIQKKLKQTTLDEDRTFTYNSDGTIKEIKMSSINAITSFTYKTGGADYLIMEDGKKRGEGELVITNGKLTSFACTYFDDQGQVNSTQSLNYLYNEKGLVKRATYSNGNYIEYSYDNNSDLVSYTVFTNLGVAFEKIEYTYSNKIDRFPQYSFLNCSDVSFLLPAFSKHLPATQKVFTLPNGQLVQESVFTHTLDADGYVIKGSKNQTLGGQSYWEWEHIYQ